MVSAALALGERPAPFELATRQLAPRFWYAIFPHFSTGNTTEKAARSPRVAAMAGRVAALHRTTAARRLSKTRQPPHTGFDTARDTSGLATVGASAHRYGRHRTRSSHSPPARTTGFAGRLRLSQAQSHAARSRHRGSRPVVLTSGPAAKMEILRAHAQWDPGAGATVFRVVTQYHALQTNCNICLL